VSEKAQIYCFIGNKKIHIAKYFTFFFRRSTGVTVFIVNELGLDRIF